MNIKLWKFISCVVALAVLVSAIPVIECEAAEPVSVAYLALGDSGTDYQTYAGKSWTSYPVYTEEKLEKANNVDVIVRNDAKGGFRITDLLEQIKTDSQVIEDIKKADFITIDIAGNDILHCMQIAVEAAGYSMGDLMGYSGTVTTKSGVYKAAASALGNKKNPYHDFYISSVKNRIAETVSVIKSYNPNCKIGITTGGYSDQYGAKTLAAILNMNASTASSFAKSYKIAVNEIQGYFIDIAAADSNVYYIDLNELCSPEYLQYNENGICIDSHPNYEGQLKMADCFIRDFWSNVDLSKSRGEYAEKPASPYYPMTAVDVSGVFSSQNATLGDVNTLILNKNGVGCKLYGTKETYAKEFEVQIQPPRASGTVTGLSFWDNSNKSEILIRFEGTNTSKLKVCAGGKGTYVSTTINLGYDASAKLHKYSVSFDNDKVTIKVDGKTKGSLDVSSVPSPTEKVVPIEFLEKVGWTGTFQNKQVSATFAYLK